ncbi:hypothetical protein [Azohydromonas caseinilytica]|uniref:Uncharacterized protein n=1 Tax=Azohydromonas caseinilytica TaxID=2728836 RepID=A0A848FBP9_9BURK|nr:hypothetical protein [Azohydromonas caseinilytica]NML15743.1 hypothetical protein [Azohydromonas caseinilytica]
MGCKTFSKLAAVSVVLCASASAHSQKMLLPDPNVSQVTTHVFSGSWQEERAGTVYHLVLRVRSDIFLHDPTQNTTSIKLQEFYSNESSGAYGSRSAWNCIVEGAFLAMKTDSANFSATVDFNKCGIFGGEQYDPVTNTSTPWSFPASFSVELKVVEPTISFQSMVVSVARDQISGAQSKSNCQTASKEGGVGTILVDAVVKPINQGGQFIRSLCKNI